MEIVTPLYEAAARTWSSASSGVPETVRFRTETLVRFTAVQVVSRHEFEAAELPVQEDVGRRLRMALAAQLAAVGRVQHDEIEFTCHEDHPRDEVMFTAIVWTREDQSGEWPSIRAALREDGIL